jgi:ADP-heptose:LPS heptosyltransferase
MNMELITSTLPIKELLEKVDLEESLLISFPPVDQSLPSAQNWAGVCRMGGIGDNLIAASVLAPLKKQGYRVEVISQEPYSSVFVNNPSVDKLTIKVPEDIPQTQNDWQMWFAVRAKEYAKFGNLSHSCETLGALLPAQTAFWWPPSMRRKMCNRNYLEIVHDIMEVPYEFGSLFFPTDGERSVAAETKSRIGDKVIGWCLSGTRLDKIYPYSPMVVARIIKEIGAPVVLLGAPGKNFEMAQTIQDHVRRQNGSEAGLHVAISPEADNKSWPIRRGLAFAMACDLVVTPDTGPAWSVAFEKMPKIVMLSHASPENVTKHWVNTTTLHAGSEVACWPCHRLHDVKDTCKANREGNGAACISDISVEKLMLTISQLWKKEPDNGEYCRLRAESDA